MNPQLSPQTQEYAALGGETLPQALPETAPSPAVAPAAAPAAAPVQYPVTLPASQAPVAQAAPSAASTPSVSGPAIAGDVDVIEKEWVDKAEALVKMTAGDPHAEEEAVEALQIDYLQKRYGRTVQESDSKQ